jgi:hypothetical protein
MHPGPQWWLLCPVLAVGGLAVKAIIACPQILQPAAAAPVRYKFKRLVGCRDHRVVVWKRT